MLAISVGENFFNEVVALSLQQRKLVLQRIFVNQNLINQFNQSVLFLSERKGIDNKQLIHIQMSIKLPTGVVITFH